MRVMSAFLTIVLLLFSASCVVRGEIMEEKLPDKDYCLITDLETRYSYCDDVKLTTIRTLALTSLPTFVDISLCNSSIDGYMYSKHCMLEWNNGGIWYTFPPNLAHDVLIYLGSNICSAVSLNIENYHERMNVGLYRIVCFVSKAEYEYDSSGDLMIVSCEILV